jgi:ATP-dependent Clp protease ATP-binding subunit ClpA
MFERFTKDARATVHAAQAEAAGLGSPVIEAEHLLLALAASGEPTLVEAGLDRERVLAALEDETAHSLAVVGVGWDEPPGPVATVAAPRFAASAKLALERTLKAALGRGDRRLTASHVLLGVLAAEVGTVPRALALAGVDREALAAAVRT